jgi:hypothetical protein
MTDQLKQAVQKYCQVDNELRMLNTQVYAKRDLRKQVETEIAGFVSLPQFSDIQKVKVEEDGSYIRIQRPETYTKPWSLSKKELEQLLQSYFQTSRNPSADECSKFIVEQRKQVLIGKEFEFVRIVPDE